MAAKLPDPADEWEHWSAADVSAPGGFAKHILGADPNSWVAYVQNDAVPTIFDDYTGTSESVIASNFADTSDAVPDDDPDGSDE